MSPNWVYNTLRITKGDPQEVWDAVKSITEEGGERKIDYNRLIPQPADLYRGSLGKEDFVKYGKHNWYDWSIANWHSKWNAVETSLEENVLRWMSPWSPPMPVMERLFAMFPNHDFRYYWEEEQGGGDLLTIVSGVRTSVGFDNINGAGEPSLIEEMGSNVDGGIRYSGKGDRGSGSTDISISRVRFLQRPFRLSEIACTQKLPCVCTAGGKPNLGNFAIGD